MIFVLLGLGICVIHESVYHDGPIPPPLQPSYVTQLAALSNTSYNKWGSPEENWEALQPTLLIVKDVCPHVEEWVRDRHRQGKIVWETRVTNTIARYNFGTGELIINLCMFSYEDGLKASFLAHEWRHSRQNWIKPLRAGICYHLTGKVNSELIETDAKLYEADVYFTLHRDLHRFDPVEMLR